MITSCSYCHGKKCGLKEMLSCKTREIMEENKGLESKLQEYMQADLTQSKEIENWKKVIEPILKVNLNETFHLSEDCIVAIQEAQRLHKDLIASNY